MKRRKHCIVVEITFDEPTTDKVARSTVKDLARQGEAVERNCSSHIPHPPITKIDAKSFNRVIASRQA